jgi:hypothetical protein
VKIRPVGGSDGTGLYGMPAGYLPYRQLLLKPPVRYGDGCRIYGCLYGRIYGDGEQPYCGRSSCLPHPTMHPRSQGPVLFYWLARHLQTMHFIPPFFLLPVFSPRPACRTAPALPSHLSLERSDSLRHTALLCVALLLCFPPTSPHASPSPSTNLDANQVILGRLAPQTRLDSIGSSSAL